MLSEHEARRLIDQARQKYEQACAAAKEALDRDIEAVNRVLELTELGRCEVAKDETSTADRFGQTVGAGYSGRSTRNGSGSETRTERLPRGFVRKAVLDAITRVANDTFTWQTVSQLIAESQGVEIEDSSIRQVFPKLIEIGELEIAEEGAGRRATRYRRPQREKSRTGR